MKGGADWSSIVRCAGLRRPARGVYRLAPHGPRRTDPCYPPLRDGAVRPMAVLADHLSQRPASRPICGSRWSEPGTYGLGRLIAWCVTPHEEATAPRPAPSAAPVAPLQEGRGGRRMAASQAKIKEIIPMIGVLGHCVDARITSGHDGVRGDKRVWRRTEYPCHPAPRHPEVLAAASLEGRRRWMQGTGLWLAAPACVLRGRPDGRHLSMTRSLCRHPLRVHAFLPTCTPARMPGSRPGMTARGERQK